MFQFCPMGQRWPQTDVDLEAIRRSVLRGQPYGSDSWVRAPWAGNRLCASAVARVSK